jgi:WD40 repeat protein
LYDGKTGEPKCKIGDDEHKGSIFGVSWARDSKKFVTASADQTVKVWDVEAGRVVQNWRFGEEGVVSIPNHQVGIVWPAGRSDGLIINLNLDGDFNYVCEGTQKPVRVIQGHQRNITAIGISGDGNAKTETLWTGSFEGRVCSWDISAGIGEVVDGQTHTNQVTGFTATADRIYSTGWDDTLRTIDTSAKTFTGSTVKLGSQPRGISQSLKSKTVFAATVEGIEVYDEGGKKISDFRTGFTPTSIAASETYVAVGGDDHAVRIYTVSGGSKLVLQNELKASTAVVTALAFSPSGLYLAAGNSGGKITVYDTKAWNVVTDRWSSHTARVTSIAWNSEGTHAVSGGLDTNVFVWSLAKPGARIKAPNAHKDGVNGVAWIGNGKAVASVGADAAVKTWKVDGLA